MEKSNIKKLIITWEGHPWERYLADFCQINNIGIKEQKINIDDLMNAQEVFLTSATGFVLPVIEVNGRRVGNGLVGDTVKKIQNIYIEQIKAKLS